jgi:light-regulated signal transduction histidine kinase (bacteriophytochrome)
MVQLLQKRYGNQLDEHADQYIDLAVDAATRMQTLINDLLDFSRVDRRGKPFAPTAMASVIKSALNNLSVAIQNSGAVITSDEMPELMIDSTQMTRVIQNLLSNAIKFQSNHSPVIHISAQLQGNEWRFGIHDNGIGIEPQYFDRIFVVFQRLHTRTEYPGTGIGLAIVKKIVDRHDGRIWVESQFGTGSTFYFTIPVRKLSNDA